MPATKEKSGGQAQPFAISVVPVLRRYPVGALTGIVLTGILTLVTDAVPTKPWVELPITLICVPGCMLIERCSTGATPGRWTRGCATPRPMRTPGSRSRSWRSTRRPGASTSQMLTNWLRPSQSGTWRAVLGMRRRAGGIGSGPRRRRRPAPRRRLNPWVHPGRLVVSGQPRELPCTSIASMTWISLRLGA